MKTMKDCLRWSPRWPINCHTSSFMICSHKLLGRVMQKPPGQ